MQTLSLNGVWSLQEAGMREEILATVPGTVHTDLFAAGKIPDPFFRDHEKKLQWISEKNWLYRRHFSVEADFLAQPVVELVCEGLDTFATVMINGQKLGMANNQHRIWVFDVRSALKVGDNVLEIRFDTVLPYMRRKNAEKKLPEWKGAWEEGGRGYVRKMASNFGWDWGPVLTTAGIWRNIALRAYENRLEEVYIQQHHAPNEVRLDVTAFLTTSAGAVKVTLFYEEEAVAFAHAERLQNVAETSFVVHDPFLWYPQGMGAQPLYTLRVVLEDDAGGQDVWEKQIGLRTIKLRQPKDTWGQAFYFEANGLPFFAKGANWIPGDALYTRFQDYDTILGAAAEAHMNMIRIWGGGIYEQPAFYEACDRLGLVVWQDFMFACSNYPGRDPQFLANIKAEAEDNVRRLRHHACLGLWCGNNELELGLVGKIGTAWNGVWEDYDPIFNEALRSVVQRLDPQRDYVSGSPHNPIDRSSLNDPRAGDVHLWQVWHKQEPFEWYRTSFHRFVSEFGFQSFPEPQYVARFTAPEDRRLDSPVMLAHQRSVVSKQSGNFTIMQYAAAWFKAPPNFEATLWQSQLLQALAMQYAVEHWRRNMPRCMGALYWQLNDCWPVASWSSLDFEGRWKALHYHAKRFFAPILLSIVEDVKKYTAAIHLTNDNPIPFEGSITWAIYHTDGRKLATGLCPQSSVTNGAAWLQTLSLAPLVQAHGANHLIIYACAMQNGALVSENMANLVKPKDLKLQKPSFEIKVETVETGRLQVTLRSDKPALWTWLTHPEGSFPCSDNFFHLMPQTEKTVIVKTKLGETAFRESVQVQTVIDVQQT